MLTKPGETLMSRNVPGVVVVVVAAAATDTAVEFVLFSPS